MQMKVSKKVKVAWACRNVTFLTRNTTPKDRVEWVTGFDYG